MDFGVHLPLLDLDGPAVPPSQVLEYAQHVEQLGFAALAAHDHLVHTRPWLDGPTTLAAVVSHTRHIPLITAVWLPVVRGPIALVRAFTALDLLSGGRVIAGIGAGSSAQDYAAGGIPFEERWARFDESIALLRAAWRPDAAPFHGRFYSTEDFTLEPGPMRAGGPPLWIGAWGSPAGLRRTAELGDGWIASAYNTTPELFGRALIDLGERLRRVGKDPGRFPNAIATMALFVTDDGAEARRILHDVLSQALHRSEDDLRRRVLVGSPEECAVLLRAYRAAGTQRMLLMPVRDGFRQLDLFRERVTPLMEDASSG
ncbi:MAG: hypothetical protein QOF51_3233 [Chloroflexota bacterium]|nr:hypothetical protein [Chloroflexota bacterium]